MNLKSERLKLKEITWNDIANIHNLHSIPEVEEYNTIGIPKNLGTTKELLRPAINDQKNDQRKTYVWNLLLKDSDTFIGIAGMSVSNDRFNYGEIYYKLHPDYWGKGFATEAAKTIILFGFKHLKLHRIEAGVATENTRSIKVLERIGMTQEGIRRKILPIRGEWIDNFHFAIVEGDPVPYK